MLSRSSARLQRRQPSGQHLRSSAPLPVQDLQCHLFDGPALEDGAERNLDIERGPDADTSGLQAANGPQVKEAVLDSHAIDPSNSARCRRAAPQCIARLHNSVLSRAIRIGRRRALRSSLRSASAERVQDDERGGTMNRQSLPQVFPSLGSHSWIASSSGSCELRQRLTITGRSGTPPPSSVRPPAKKCAHALLRIVTERQPRSRLRGDLPQASGRIEPPMRTRRRDRFPRTERPLRSTSPRPPLGCPRAQGAAVSLLQVAKHVLRVQAGLHGSMCACRRQSPGFHMEHDVVANVHFVRRASGLRRISTP